MWRKADAFADAGPTRGHFAGRYTGCGLCVRIVHGAGLAGTVIRPQLHFRAVTI
jgi:hypothetical protein